MFYYLIDTPTGPYYAKSKVAIYSKEIARTIVNGPVNWVSRISPLTYYFNKILKRA